MNRTKIEWTDYTWNPVTGCKTGCEYCYARRISHRFHRSFEPEFHPERLDEPSKVKKPSKIFVVSMGDLFGPWVPHGWITKVLQIAWEFPQHTFQFLTKYPERYAECGTWPRNTWLGATAETDMQMLKAAFALSKVRAPVRFISMEPLLDECDFLIPDSVDWIIVGAMTGVGATKPKPEWIQEWIGQARRQNIPLFLKDNLNWPVEIKEYPRVAIGEATHG